MTILKPFSRSMPSTCTFKLLKRKAQSNPPPRALREVENSKGGVIGARSACELPRNRKQVYNIKAAVKSLPLQTPSTTNSVARTDVLAQVMLMCKESSGSQAQ